MLNLLQLLGIGLNEPKTGHELGQMHLHQFVQDAYGGTNVRTTSAANI
jgi:hypothetical protein